MCAPIRNSAPINSPRSSRLLKLLSDGMEDVDRIVADGIGQLAAVCVAGAISLEAAARWLKSDCSCESSPLLGAPASEYAIHCDCSAMRNPALERHRLARTDAVREGQRASGLLGARNGDAFLLNLDGSDSRRRRRQCTADSVLRLDAKPDNLRTNFAKLALAIRSLATLVTTTMASCVCRPIHGSVSRFGSVKSSRPKRRATGGPDFSKMNAPRSVPAATAGDVHELLGARIDAPHFSCGATNSPRPPRPISPTSVQGTTLLPGSAFVELGLAVHHAMTGCSTALLQDLQFHKALVVAEAGAAVDPHDLRRAAR